MNANERKYKTHKHYIKPWAGISDSVAGIARVGAGNAIAYAGLQRSLPTVIFICVHSRSFAEDL